jgi:hypothetical protein
MAFAEPWIETEPDGAIITVSLLDNYIRQAKIAVRERMEGDSADVLTGLIEPGTWETGPLAKAGSARFFVGPEADVNDAALFSDGRGYFTNGAAGSPKVFHLSTGGAIQINYLNRDGSRNMEGKLTVRRSVAAAMVNGTAHSDQLVAEDGSYTIDVVTGFQILSPIRGVGVTFGATRGLQIENQQLGGMTEDVCHAIYTGTGRVRFGDEVYVEATGGLIVNSTGSGNALITFLGGAANTMILQGNAGVITALVQTEFAVRMSVSGLFPLRVLANGNVAAGLPAPATNATAGFFWIPTMNGTPTGVPPLITGYRPLVYDESNERLAVWDGSWKQVTLT